MPFVLGDQEPLTSPNLPARKGIRSLRHAQPAELIGGSGLRGSRPRRWLVALRRVPGSRLRNARRPAPDSACVAAATCRCLGRRGGLMDGAAGRNRLRWLAACWPWSHRPPLADLAYGPRGHGDQPAGGQPVPGPGRGLGRPPRGSPERVASERCPSCSASWDLRQVQFSKHERASSLYGTLNPPTSSVDPG